MTFSMKGNVAYLSGDWRLICLTKDNINSLTALLQQLEAGHIRTLQLDCHLMTSTDAAGLQLIKVWMQCMKIRGMEPELTNPPEILLPYFKSAGLSYKFTSNHLKTNSFEEQMSSAA